MKESKYNIIYLPIAYKDLIELSQYLLDNSLSATQEINYIKGLEDRIKSLEKLPFRGTVYNSNKRRKDEYRMIFYKHHSIFYIINECSIEIRRILHKKRNINKII